MVDDDKDVALKLLVAPWALGLVWLFALAGLYYETWVALTLFDWFAPWTMPLTLTQAVGLNVAVSLVVRQVKPKDDRDTTDLLKVGLAFYFVSPTLALVTMWVIRWLNT